jgi:RimJ/RimL family protein N-acetyltransferase
MEVGEGGRLRELRLAALREDPGAFGSSSERETTYEPLHWEMLAGGPGAVFVGGDWDGMAGVYLEAQEPRLWGMWVAPSARGRGLGRALAEAVIGWARDRAFTRLRLGVTAAAPDALRLYERLGFAATGRVTPLRSDQSLCEHELALELHPEPRRIETERLVLRPFEPGDLAAVHDIHRRPEMVRWLYEDAARTLEDDRPWLEGRIRRVRFALSGDGLGFAAVRDGTVIGDLSLTLTSAEHRQGEIGFLVHPDQQGRGYATEAAGALLALAFDTFALHRVVGRLEARNVASARVLEKLGMRREAHLVENELVKGEWQSELVYAMLRASRGA